LYQVSHRGRSAARASDEENGIAYADSARFTMSIEGLPSPSNPRTGRLTPLSVIAALRGLVSEIEIGS